MDDLVYEYAIAYRDPTPYMDGPRTVHVGRWKSVKDARAAKMVLVNRTYSGDLKDLRIEKRQIGPWEVVE